MTRQEIHRLILLKRANGRTWLTGGSEHCAFRTLIDRLVDWRPNSRMSAPVFGFACNGPGIVVGALAIWPSLCKDGPGKQWSA